MTPAKLDAAAQRVVGVLSDLEEEGFTPAELVAICHRVTSVADQTFALQVSLERRDEEEEDIDPPPTVRSAP